MIYLTCNYIVCMYMFIRVHIYIYIYIYMYLSLSLYIYIYIYIRTHIYTHTHTLLRALIRSSCWRALRHVRQCYATRHHFSTSCRVTV